MKRASVAAVAIAAMVSTSDCARDTVLGSLGECIARCSVGCSAPGSLCFSDGAQYCSACVAACYGASEVACPSDGGTDGGVCPLAAPLGSVACSGNVECTYGTETCCGESHPSLVCTCSGTQFSCYNTDACLGAPASCPDGGTDGGVCPSSAPLAGELCSGNLQCTYGTETCCGETYPSLVCTCSGTQFGCYYTDACLGAPVTCPDAGPDACEQNCGSGCANPDAVCFSDGRFYCSDCHAQCHGATAVECPDGGRTSLFGSIPCGTLTCQTNQLCMTRSSGIDGGTDAGGASQFHQCVDAPVPCTDLADCLSFSSSGCGACANAVCGPWPAMRVSGRNVDCMGG